MNRTSHPFHDKAVAKLEINTVTSKKRQQGRVDLPNKERGTTVAKPRILRQDGRW